MLLSLGCFTANALLIKHLTVVRSVDFWLTVSVRFGVGLLMTMVLFAPSGALDLRRMFLSRLLASRGVLGALSTAAYYATVRHLGVGKATLIGNTWCVWSAVMAVFVVHEKLGISKFLGILVAISGLALLTDISPASLARDGRWELIALLGAIGAAMVVVVIRQLTRTETSATIFASQCVYGLLLAVPFAAAHYTRITGPDAALLVGAALAASVGQIGMTEGFRFLTVAAGGAFQTTLPLVISLGGVLFFGEQFSLAQAMGGALILAGSFQTVVGLRWRRNRNDPPAHGTTPPD